MVELAIDSIKIKAATKPDLFSPKGLDQGTKLLLESIVAKKYQRVLDWGCGWGAIALFAAKLRPAAEVIALDSDIAAVQMARENAFTNLLDNVEVIASHSFSELDEAARFDLILSNPPSHRGREVVEDMVRQARTRLLSGGELMVVVESRISPWLKRTLREVFGDYKIVRRGPKNVVLSAKNPSTSV